MADAVDTNTRLVFIANPNNPTGTWVPRDDLRRFVAALPETCLVVLDEAYFEYARAHGGSDGVEWLDDFEHLVVLRTFSKAYGLAGLRVGYGLAHADVAAILERVRQPFNVSSLALAAAHAALQDSNHLARSITLVDDGRELLRRGLGDLRWPVLPSAGNFLLVEFGDMAAQYYHELLRAGLIVRPVANYQLPRHLRITIGTAAQNARLLAALGALRR
jgi:histidinol-phosphate aminotransferase